MCWVRRPNTTRENIHRVSYIYKYHTFWRKRIKKRILKEAPHHPYGAPPRKAGRDWNLAPPWGEAQSQSYASLLAITNLLLGEVRNERSEEQMSTKLTEGSSKINNIILCSINSRNWIDEIPDEELLQLISFVDNSSSSMTGTHKHNPP